MTTTFTAEFRDEWEREREVKFRRRFMWYAGTVVIVSLVIMAAGVTASLVFPEGAEPNLEAPMVLTSATAERLGVEAESFGALAWRSTFIQFGFSLLAVLLYLWGFVQVKANRPTRQRLVDLTAWLILVTGVLNFIATAVGYEVIAAAAPEAFYSLAASQADFAVMGIGLGFSVLLTHTLASFFLPWTARESLRPIWPLLVFNTVLTMILAWDRPGLLAATVLSAPLFAAPGTIIAWWKHSRFRNRFHVRAVRERYGKLRRELVDARKIHEQMFPQPIDSGPLRLRLTYRPAQHIGGDYVFAQPVEPGPADGAGGIHLIVIDVTGHGVRAALTVNRIHGELQRLLALDPASTPGSLLASLNEYLHLTVANHSLFATALAIYADLDRGVIRWASAGHPPAILRSADGRIFRLAPTAIVLGAVPPDQFEAEIEELPFGEGDSLIAYTDGATETVDRSGKMVRVQGFEAMVASAPHSRERPHEADLTAHLASRLDEVRAGPAEDDTLIVQLSRSVVAKPSATTAAALSASSA